jgi:hypothetical protein
MSTVWSGRTIDGIEWSLSSYYEDGDLFTFIDARKGEQRISGGGFGGPAVPPGLRLNSWVGQSDDMPIFIVVRTLPDVERVDAVDRSGSTHPIELSPVVEDFTLRFGVLRVPDGVHVVELIARPGVEGPVALRDPRTARLG